MRTRTPKAYVIRYTSNDKPLPNYRLHYYWFNNIHYLKVQIPCDCDCHNMITFGHSFGQCCQDRWRTLAILKFTTI